MKNFFTTVLGSFVGVWLALILFSVISVIMSFAIFGSMLGSMSEGTKPVQDKSILYINLKGAIPERSLGQDMLSTILKEEGSGSSLETILNSIKVAKDNDKIKGIFIECNGNGGGLASLYEIRNALNDFKASKKFVYAYGNEGISQGDYYVASAADSVFLNPVGVVDIHGLSATIPFFKNLLDKIGVEMQVIRVGSFKSAVEPFIATEASPANRLQNEVYMKSLWGNMCDSISKSRKISVEKLNIIADSMLITQKGECLIANKIVDKLYYRFQVIDNLKTLTGIEKTDDIRFATPDEVCALKKDKESSDNKIAVIYAEGEIDGTSDNGINSADLCKDIIDIASNEDVKGVVLRVNSPGGSAFGSEQIWKALEEVKKAGKPFAVSMGDVAASGGYYISCGADRIFAEPVTITGSIGIFGMIPCFKGLMEDKLGITQSVISTNANGNLMSVTEPMTPIQRAAMQRMINNGYDLFTHRCATGRKMPIDSLLAIAQGRVWDGINAKKIGLIDAYGNVQDAIKWVTTKAKLTNYTLENYPELQDPFLKYLNGYMTTKMNAMVANETGELYKYHNVAKQILGRDHIQCLMEPVVIR